MIRQRIHAGLKAAMAAIVTQGKFTAGAPASSAKRLGRPNADPKEVAAARRYMAQGMGVLKTASWRDRERARSNG